MLLSNNLILLNDYEQRRIKSIAIKYKSAKASDQEKALFETWYLQYQEEGPSNYTVDEILEDLDLVWTALEGKFNK
ncbi:hypothetical protein [Pedobacter heparinus]|uniref:hypothetical protein n=1 Tax=Pedobacter heparinus TaxID=984 RepID=UPI00292EDC8F|nr:hypothetical protein [Pedobacter heparinus]